jgi:transcriptional regulator with XRE-family HTH domain
MKESTLNEDTIYNHIRHNLRALRKKHNHSQADLAKVLCVTRATVANIELGNQRLATHLAIRIAYHYKVDITKILPSIDDLKNTKTVDITITLNNILMQGRNKTTLTTIAKKAAMKALE